MVYSKIKKHNVYPFKPTIVILHLHNVWFMGFKLLVHGRIGIMLSKGEYDPKETEMVRVKRRHTL